MIRLNDYRRPYRKLEAWEKEAISAKSRKDKQKYRRHGMKLYMDTSRGKPSENHEVHVYGAGMYLYSYGTLVAYRSHDDYYRYVDSEGQHKVSRTTKRYVELFLGQEVEETAEADLEFMLKRSELTGE